jgi:hypothetical protein
MPLKGPTSADVTKLHAEITQCVNHRFWVMLTALSVFAAVVGFTISSSKPPDTAPGPARAAVARPEIQPLTPALCAAANIMYLILFASTVVIMSDLSVLASYLRYTGKSGWEEDYQTAEGQRLVTFFNFGYSRMIFTVFLAIIGFTTLLPSCLLLVYAVNNTPEYATAQTANTGVGFACGIAVLAITLFTRNMEENWHAKWGKIK